MVFELVIDDRASRDIEDGMDYYKSVSHNVMQAFYHAILNGFKELCSNPYFQIRYDNIRCYPLRKFPFMIHYKLDESDKTIIILGVLNTYRDPNRYYITT